MAAAARQAAGRTDARCCRLGGWSGAARGPGAAAAAGLSRAQLRSELYSALGPIVPLELVGKQQLTCVRSRGLGARLPRRCGLSPLLFEIKSSGWSSIQHANNAGPCRPPPQKLCRAEGLLHHAPALHAGQDWQLAGAGHLAHRQASGAARGGAGLRSGAQSGAGAAGYELRRGWGCRRVAQAGLVTVAVSERLTAADQHAAQVWRGGAGGGGESAGGPCCRAAPWRAAGEMAPEACSSWPSSPLAAGRCLTPRAACATCALWTASPLPTGSSRMAARSSR